MTTYRHRVTGPGSAGDIWVSTLHSSSANTLASVHTAWTTFVNSFCSGTLNAMWNTHQSATEVITDQLDPVTGKQTAKAALGNIVRRGDELLVRFERANKGK